MTIGQSLGTTSFAAKKASRTRHESYSLWCEKPKRSFRTGDARCFSTSKAIPTSKAASTSLYLMRVADVRDDFTEGGQRI